jgi:hypothetical protein
VRKPGITIGTRQPNLFDKLGEMVALQRRQLRVEGGAQIADLPAAVRIPEPVITGGTFQTGPDGEPRVVITDEADALGALIHVTFETGEAVGVDGGLWCWEYMNPGLDSRQWRVVLSSPGVNGQDVASISLLSAAADGSAPAEVQLYPTPAFHFIGATNEPAFANSWVNYDSSTYAALKFRKTFDGTGEMFGCIKDGSNQARCFTLPAGYRPTKIHRRPILVGGDVLGVCTVQPNGYVVIDVKTGTNAAVWLTGVTWPCEQ